MDLPTTNLIFTSPPYANQRAGRYDGVHPDEYVEWFLPKAQRFYDCLTNDGSFVLNIKEHARDGEKHRYVYELCLALRDQGWRLVDEYIWHKVDCFPGGHFPDRFRDAWERIYHFCKVRNFKINRKDVRVPPSQSTLNSIRSLKNHAIKKTESNSQLDTLIPSRMNTDLCYPSNVLELNTVKKNMGHPAVFPKSLPDWFIRLLTDKGDTVLDPFAGSGTTLIAAMELNRKYIGIEKNKEYVELIHGNINQTQPVLNL